MRRSWAASLLFAAALLGASGAPTLAGEAPRSRSGAGAEAARVQAGWMGRFARRDPALAGLLSGQAGWGRFREMALFEALQFFSGSEAPADRLGAARTYLALADLAGALDGIFLEAEAAYLDGLGPGAGPGQQVRRALVHLRRGDLAASALEGAAPQGQSFAWALARTGAAAGAGDREGAKARLAKAPAPTSDAERTLGQVASYAWGLPWEGRGRGPYDQAVAGFRRGDLAGGILSLQMQDFEGGGTGPDPGLFLYPLLRRAFAGLALAAAGEGATPELAFLAGQAQEHLGAWAPAATAFGKVVGTGPGADAAWVFSPFHGLEEAAAVARVGAGAALYRDGRKAEAALAWREAHSGDPGPLALAWLAATQAELGAAEPLGSPSTAAGAALAAVNALPGQAAGEGAELLSSLYPARVAAVAHLAARVERASGDRRAAADLLDRAHSKAAGYRPSFVNPPAYLADLAREYAAAGEYAPAVAVMFDLAGEDPSARLAYESLKRLYASRTGGEAPPR